ncbi:MAG: hypothetical protein ACM3U0_00480 [archaeon]
MINLFPIIIGLLLILAKDKILDYYDRFNREYSRHLNRKIWATRLMIAGIISIAIGVINFFRTY